MVNKYKACWEQCLQLIKNNVTSQQFETWFAPIVFESFSPEKRTLLVQVPSSFVYEYLEQHFVGLMSKVLTHCFGTSVKLTYRIVTDKAHNLSQVIEVDPPTEINEPQMRKEVNRSPSMLDVAKPQDINTQLNPKQTFSNYIEGTSNKLPRTV